MFNNYEKFKVFFDDLLTNVDSKYAFVRLTYEKAKSELKMYIRSRDIKYYRSYFVLIGVVEDYLTMECHVYGFSGYIERFITEEGGYIWLNY